MKRNVMFIGLCLAVLSAPALGVDGEDRAKQEATRIQGEASSRQPGKLAVKTDSGVYIIANTTAGVGTSKTHKVMLSPNLKVYVSVATIDDADSRTVAVHTAMQELRARHNNVYAMAVNTAGIQRATHAVRVGGRVVLQGTGGSTGGDVTVASRD